MQLLIGLGNPGDKYRDTRHNIGFRFLDRLCQQQGLRFAAAPRLRAETTRWQSAGEQALLVKPQTFMNHSGEAVAPLARYYKVPADRIFVVYDDLDLPPGKLRIKKGGGHGGHNGLKSINQHLGDSGYTRIKFGIGRPQGLADVTSWVLGKAERQDRELEAASFDCLLPEITTILDGHAPRAANHIHLCMQKKLAAIMPDEEAR
ncbi:MAG: aminoacyl-tRNA hydrolase [Mariprofundaceae bacterium]